MAQASTKAIARPHAVSASLSPNFSRKRIVLPSMLKGREVPGCDAIAACAVKAMSSVIKHKKIVGGEQLDGLLERVIERGSGGL